MVSYTIRSFENVLGINLGESRPDGLHELLVQREGGRFVSFLVWIVNILVERSPNFC